MEISTGESLIAFQNSRTILLEVAWLTAKGNSTSYRPRNELLEYGFAGVTASE